MDNLGKALFAIFEPTHVFTFYVGKPLQYTLSDNLEAWLPWEIRRPLFEKTAERIAIEGNWMGLLFGEEPEIDNDFFRRVVALDPPL